MLEKLTFKNHINERIDFGDGGLYVNYNDLHDYQWNHSDSGDRIRKFSRGIQSRSIPVVIFCNSEKEGLLLKNRLMEYADKDVLAQQYGRLILNGYYMNCYIVGSKKSGYLWDKGYMKATLSIITDHPQWIKESTVSFRADGRDIKNGENIVASGQKRNLDYNYDFPFDYMSFMLRKTLNNTGFTETNFRLIIYGAAVNPAIHIGNHKYQVNCTIQDGEYLTVDSLAKTIVLTKHDGTAENHFNDRSRDSYIFKPISAGNNTVTWNKTFGFDVVILEERSEPKWI